MSLESRRLGDTTHARLVFPHELCEQTAPLRDGADVAKWLVEVLDGLSVHRVHLAGNFVGEHDQVRV